MARSLVIKHEEDLSISPLFAGFVLLAIACLLVSAASGWTDPAMDTAPVEHLTR